MISPAKSINVRCIFLLFFALLIFGGTLTVTQAQDTPTTAELWDELEAATGGKLETSTGRATGNVTMIRAGGGAVLFADEAASRPVDRAHNFLAAYGSLMGIEQPRRELHTAEIIQDEIGMTHVRMDQVYNKVPVFGAEVVVHMNAEGITTVNGTFIPEVSVNTQPALSMEAAQAAAVGAVVKEDPAATAKAAALTIYPAGLWSGTGVDSHLAYAVEVHGDLVADQVFIDAHTGTLLDRIPLHHTDLHRIIYSPQYDPNNPDMFVQASEDDPPNLLDAPPIHDLYNFAGQVYNFFFNAFGRDSYDGAGHIMRSVYLVNNICPNAYWNGSSTNYCPGFDLDDVVAHEWGHAYTEYTHGLVYQWQSGALNESYSDIWGETVDLHNGQDGIGGSNNEEPYPAGQRWIMGEDLTDPVMTLLLRDMWDPERLGYPAKVSSDNYYCGTGDGGGVHYNSGVPNHAFAMLVDGKTFNGQTVNGIGFDKATQIYWRAGRVYQVPSTFFPEHADALEASCGDLIGTEVPDFQTGLPSGEVITQTDCDQVAKAMLAVEMREEPLQCNFQPLLDPNTPAMCETPEFVLNEDWESGMDGWTMTTEAGATGDSWPDYNWELDGSLPAGRSGTGMFAISEITGTCAPGGDISGHFTMDSPLFTVPDPLNDLELRFDHYVATEANYDGGNLKASVNGGEFAVVPSSAYTFNPYNITLTSSLDGNTNPMAGEEAYSGSDGGQLSGSWGTSIVDLTALDVSPGDTVQLRWDFGVDGCNGLEGWYVDTVQAFTCDGSGSTNNPPDAVNDSASVERGQQVVVSVLDNDSDADGDTLTITSFTQGSFGMVTDNGNGTLNYAHDGSASSADSFAYTIADGNGGEDTATVSMTITDPPPPAGEGQTTGGGWLAATDGGKLNFGFQAEAAGGQFSGELQLNDKAAGVKIDVSEITSFDAAGSNCGLSGGNVVEFHGNGTFNGAAGASYRICVQDNGEPGRDSDRFSLTCTAGCAYDTGAREMDDVLDGGNIQVETGGGAQPTGNNPESGGAATLILDPLLLTEGPAGQLQLFAVRVYDADQALLANATVTLTRVRPDGTEETFTALSGVDGVALFNLVNLSSVAELIASANGVQSNVIEITPLIP